MQSAVLVIDVQRVLFEPQPQPYESDVIIKKINQLTAWARDEHFPVIFIQHEEVGTEIEADTEGWQIHQGLLIESSDYKVRKTTPDSFLNTNLEALLNQLSIERLIICGYATEFCVDTTARRAAGLKYPVTLVGDAHTTHDKPHATAAQIRAHHNATLPSIASFGVKIEALNVEQVIG